jgi:hypothetical protein
MLKKLPDINFKHIFSYIYKDEEFLEKNKGVFI